MKENIGGRFIKLINNMREIKFRAWDKEEKYYRYLDFDDAMMSEFGIDGCLEFRGQYTGLKDSKGVEIFEGDIMVHLPSGTAPHHSFKVIWDKTMAGFQIEGKENWNDWLEGYTKEYKIIGNIYENPELIKV